VAFFYKGSCFVKENIFSTQLSEDAVREEIVKMNSRMAFFSVNIKYSRGHEWLTSDFLFFGIQVDNTIEID